MLRRLSILSLLVLGGALISIAQKPPATPPPRSATFRISGTAINLGDGQPLSAVEVTIASTEQRQQTQEVVTGPDGRFRFDNLVSGKYSLAGHRTGFAAQFYQQHDEFSTAIAVGPGLASENLAFTLTPDGSISGLVLDEENEPVRGGQVMLFVRSTGAVRVQGESTLDEQGRYHFGHLRPGIYFVAIVAQPWYAQDRLVIRQPGSLSVEGTSSPTQLIPQPSDQPETTTPSPLDVTYPATYYPAATESENAAPIPLRAGERVVADVNLRAVPAIRLRIRSATSDAKRPLGGIVQQRIFDSVVPVQQRSQQSTPGALTITGVAPGHIVLGISSFNGKDWTSLNKEVDLTADTDIDASEDHAGSVAIKGVIRLPATSPVPAGAFVRFTSPESGESFGAQASEKGTFEVQQSFAGSSNFNVAVLNVPDVVVQSVSATGATVTGHTVSLPHNGSVQLTITMAQGLSRIDGTVLRNDKPASETMVILVPQHLEDEPSLFRRDQSDSDGTFTLYQILPGRYTLVAIEKGWELDWHNPTVLKPFLEHGEVVEVAANKTYKVSLKLQSLENSAMPATSALR
ncbi:MAG TPA: carboxypeptidase-like regulatory domain-containing protein [Terriglobales bacterium]|nr:carboxypeptidase-like regulatory domain-containing protein [Terriglobales bacterium]